MRGCLKQRYKGAWSIILDVGMTTDAVTGRTRRRQKWITVRGTKREAETKLAELLRAANRGEYVEPSKVTVGTWLDEWLAKAIKPRKTASTHRTYAGVIANHLKPKLGTRKLQELTPLDLEAYYAELQRAPATAQQHHAILHSALEAGVRAGLLHRNVATLVTGKPRAEAGHADVLAHCWQAAEARAFLTTAKAAGPQPAAFYAFALDTGARRGEICGLQWADLDLAVQRVTIQRQLLSPGAPPVFGPVKNKLPRTVELSAETGELLRRHKAHQAELKMRNRRAYHDFDLVFAKEWEEVQRGRDHLGDPIQMNNFGQREFARLMTRAGVRRIKFHGLRHTCATLLLQAGVPAHVVQQRLGHKRIEMTLGIYAHALPSMQQDAASRLAALLHG